VINQAVVEEFRRLQQRREWLKQTDDHGFPMFLRRARPKPEEDEVLEQ